MSQFVFRCLVIALFAGSHCVCLRGEDSPETSEALFTLNSTLKIVEKRLASLEKRLKNLEAKHRPLGTPNDTNSEAGLFNAALLLLKNEGYSAARKEFEHFFENHPQSPLRSLALYWKGVCLLMEERYEQALSSLALFIRDWPKHPKVCPALLKQAICLQSMGEREKACRLLGTLRQCVALEKNLGVEEVKDLLEEADTLEKLLRCPGTS